MSTRDAKQPTRTAVEARNRRGASVRQMVAFCAECVDVSLDHIQKNLATETRRDDEDQQQYHIGAVKNITTDIARAVCLFEAGGCQKRESTELIKRVSTIATVLTTGLKTTKGKRNVIRILEDAVKHARLLLQALRKDLAAHAPSRTSSLVPNLQLGTSGEPPFDRP